MRKGIRSLIWALGVALVIGSGAYAVSMHQSRKIATLYPPMIYTTQGSETILYSDDLLSKRQDVLFPDGSDRACIIAAEQSQGVVEAPVGLTLTGPEYDDATIMLNNIQVSASIAAGKDISVLYLGDSVTAGYASDVNYDPASGPRRYWAIVSDLAKHAFRSYSTVRGKVSEAVGQDTYYAEARSGWKLSDYLYQAGVGEDLNPFYDASVSYRDPDLFMVKFSLRKYLAGNPPPSHVVVQLGFNDPAGPAYIRDVDCFAKAVKEQYPDTKIILSLPNSFGTWHPELYPDYALGENTEHGALTTKIIEWLPQLMAMNDPTNGVYYCPTYFVTPTAEAIPTALDGSGKKAKTVKDDGYHPNHLAHEAWAKEIFACLLYSVRSDTRQTGIGTIR